MLFEILNFSLVLLCLFQAIEGAKIAALAGRGILFARIQAKLARFELPNHEPIRCGACARRCQTDHVGLGKASFVVGGDSSLSILCAESSSK
jgi:hypothetical protein